MNWKCWIPEYGETEEDADHLLCSRYETARSAAQEYVRRKDRDNPDGYPVAWDGRAVVVFVRRDDGPAPVLEFDVSGYTTPVYVAVERT